MPMTFRPLPRGGVTLIDDGRAIGAVNSREAARRICAAVNAAEQPKQEDAAWAAHRTAA